MPKGKPSGERLYRSRKTGLVHKLLVFHLREIITWSIDVLSPREGETFLGDHELFKKEFELMD